MSPLHVRNLSRETGAYLPISEYAVIGNLRTVALVGRNGSIDWCCLPELDRPSVFGALLDYRRGGRFKVSASGVRHVVQRYLGTSCVLETIHEAEGGRLRINDFMPLSGSIVGSRDPATEPAIHRILSVEEGEVEVEVEWSPRFDYARATTRMERLGDRVLASAGERGLVLAGLPAGSGSIHDGAYGPEVHARFRLRAGERVPLLTAYLSPERHAGSHLDAFRADLDSALRRLRETREVWTEWERDNEEMPTEQWAGEWTGLLTRSELTLKLLTHPDTGAIAAAPTTSLPEDVGGVRNWDYRFSWVRDSIFVVQALYALGHSAEADDFFEFLQRSVHEAPEHRRDLQVMYGLHGGTELTEHLLEHLEGYRGSRPVRIGNGAAVQNQHDTFGELLEGGYEIARRGTRLSGGLKEFLAWVADKACGAWHKPDQGIWEMRGPPRHHVYSKVMICTGLDRAVRMAERIGLPGDADRWRRTRDVVRDVILRRGYDAELGSFTMSFGSDSLDAANLLIPVRGFLPPEDPRVQGTIDRTMERLTENGLVYRYHADDGLPGGEGAFGVCTFWLVDALALSGRLEEAWEIFTGMAERANHVGLFPEQIDPATGAFLGNFPQGYTHLGVISSLLYLRHAEGRELPYSPVLEESEWAERRSGIVG